MNQQLDFVALDTRRARAGLDGFFLSGKHRSLTIQQASEAVQRAGSQRESDINISQDRV